MSNYYKDLIGQRIDYLTILDIDEDSEIVFCKCDCGNEIKLTLDYLLEDKRVKKSCGCYNNGTKFSNLYKLWTNFTSDEKSEWGDWRTFLNWSIDNKYNELFSYHKPNRKLKYSKTNLEFGIYINSKFFNINTLNDMGYFFNEEFQIFVTSKRLKNIISNQDEITKSINRQFQKHKQIPKKVFNKLTKKLQISIENNENFK